MKVKSIGLENRLKADGSLSNTLAWDWTSVLLTWVLILIVTRRLLVTNWTEDLYIIAYIANLAYIFGLALGASHFKRLTVAFLSFVYGVFFVGWQLGLLQSSAQLWSEKLSTIFIRLSLIIQRLSERQAVYDNLLFLLVMMILYWIIGLNTAYSLMRSRDGLRLLIPLFIAIILIHTYDPLVPGRNAYLYLFSFVALMLISRLYYLQQKEHWSKKRFYIPPQLSADAFQFTLGCVLVLVTISLILPSNRNQLDFIVRAWEKLKEPFASLRQDFENAFSSLRVTIQTQPELYERTLNLGRGNELSEEEIFTAIASARLPEQTRIYWRSRVYDQYENGQWTLSNFSTREYEANSFEVEMPSFPDRPSRLQSFSIYLNQPLTTLILPAQPYWTNIAVQLEYVDNPDGTVDLLAFRSPDPLPVGKAYSARASPSTISIQQLREAGEEYPAWVADRYLNLPDTLTRRTRDLALEITQDLLTPYDKVIAITEYLRTHITYVETIEELPASQELIDWFLFDYKKGFCNYYATAEVLLLRSIGIPARLAVGFAEGTMEDLQTANVYVVRQRDAHAWPEVFFPNIGWIEFEPTSSQPAISYLQELEKNESQAEDTTSEINPQEIYQRLQEEKGNQPGVSAPPSNRFPFLILTIILFLVLISLLIWIKFNPQKVSKAYRQLPDVLENGIRSLGFSPPMILVQWNQSVKLSPIEKSYQRINSALKILGCPPPIHYTPSERASTLLKVLPEAEPEINQLLAHYQDMLYGKGETNQVETKQLEHTILRFAWQKRLRFALMKLFGRTE
jgi:transglutaminase-like putative cysteine protease